MLRWVVFGGLIFLAASAASAQAPRPAVGGIGSLPDAMIFYVAHGAQDACGPGCSDWIAAEGTVQWDTHKRLINILDRNAGRRLPVVIHVWGESNLNVATSLGRILRDRGIDTTTGITEVAACRDTSDVECFALKRPGGPLEASVKSPAAPCDLTCVLYARRRRASQPSRRNQGGSQRHGPSQPAGAERLSGSERHPARALWRTVPQISARHGRRERVLRPGRAARRIRPRVEMPASEWTRLHIVN